MFNIFKKYFARQRPEFNALKESVIKDKYFFRVATWTWHNKNEITVIDPHSPRVITMDAWPQIIFLDALGQLTVSQYIDLLSTKYFGKIPDDLDKTVILFLDDLVDLKIIEYSDSPTTLDAKVVNPINIK